MTRIGATLGLAIATLLVAPAMAQKACFEADQKVQEARSLRLQAREEARIGNRGEVCATLNEAGDRYDDAQDLFEDCGRGAVAVDLRSAHRNIDGLKKMNGCL